MNALSDWVATLPALAALALIAWIVASARRNVGLVDIAWSLFFLLAASVLAVRAPDVGARGWILIGLVALWALRLAAYLAIRNWNAPEDRRYRAIRARNEPGFAWKSLYLVFGLQALLAWLISAPLAVAIPAPGAPDALGVLGTIIAGFGIAYETVADWQLARFKADPGNSARVMDRGLWRLSRHPNYFGEFCVWWGFYLLAADAGGWWTAFSPMLMSILLLRVSGVVLLERDIGERRPDYRRYVSRTNAFFPGPSPGGLMRIVALLVALAFAVPASATAGAWNFRVMLDDREIGRHRYELQPQDDGMELRSEARFDVRFLFVSAYRYEHEAVERWQGGCLRELQSQTVTNGERVAVSARDTDGQLTVDRPGGRDVHPGCVLSFAYWDPRILEARALLNSQTGELVPVQVMRVGPEAVTVQGQDLLATRHRISGTGCRSISGTWASAGSPSKR